MLLKCEDGMRTKAQLMDEAAMNRALMRISHEIAEKNKGVDDVVLVGILRRGEPIARKIRDNIEKIEGVRVPCGSIDIVEVNISCPNVHQGGMVFGTDPSAAAAVTRRARQATRKPLFI